MRKKVLSIIAIALFASLCFTAFVACGSESGVAGTYTKEYTTAEISGNVEMNGYLVAMECTETNTLVLKDDNTYEYTKYLIQHRDTSGFLPKSVKASNDARANETDGNVLFSWTSTGDGNCTLEFNKDGTYKFSYSTMTSETGSWKWENWKMTLTKPNDDVVEIAMDDTTHAFNIHYVAVAGGGQLTHDFKLESSVWGPALGESGSYTPVSANMLFAWTSTGDGNCTLEFNKDGTYKFSYSTMTSETGTWKWENWKMTLTKPNDDVVEIAMDDTTHAFNIHYVAVAGGGQLTHDFKLESSVWGPALGESGSYTPVEGGGDDDNQGGGNDNNNSGTSTVLEIKYVFTGTYTYEEGVVTLNPATACTWKEDWGALRYTGGFLDCSGTEKDKVVRNTAYGENDPLSYFSSNFFYASGNVAVKIKLNGETFDYVEVSAFD